eukprot:153712_1
MAQTSIYKSMIMNIRKNLWIMLIPLFLILSLLIFLKMSSDGGICCNVNDRHTVSCGMYFYCPNHFGALIEGRDTFGRICSGNLNYISFISQVL